MLNLVENARKYFFAQVTGETVGRKRVKDLIALAPSTDGTVEAALNISQTVGNVYVRPKLTYVVDGDVRARPASLVLVASTVPKDELVSILREKNMIGE